MSTLFQVLPTQEPDEPLIGQRYIERKSLCCVDEHRSQTALSVPGTAVDDQSSAVLLTTLGITCSMSRAGCCYDNAMMERFFWSLTLEWTNHHAYPDLAAARPSVFRYIEMFYNCQRIHQAL